MPTVMETFLHISNISAVILVQFWPNFLDPIFFGSWFLQTKMFLGETSSDPHFFNANFFFQAQNVRAHSFYTRNSIGPQKKIKLNFFFTPNFFRPKIFPDPKYFWTQNFFKFFFSDEIFLYLQYFSKIFQSQNFCFPQFFFQKICLNTKIFFRPKIFYRSKFLDHKSYKISIISSVS